MRSPILLLLVNCLTTVFAANSDEASSFARQHDDGGANLMLNRLLQEGSNETTTEIFPFRRYLVNIRGASSNNGACPPPEPSVSINCGANLKLVDFDESTSCTMNGDSSLDCTGTGRVLVDCQATNLELEEFLTDQAALQVEIMTPVTPFSCNIAPNGFVGQGVFIGVVCRDNSVDYSLVSCDPEEQLVSPANSEPLCLQRCSQQTCTNTDLQPFTAEIRGSAETCYWDLSTSLSPSISPAPSVAPSTSLAPTSSLAPTTTGAPSFSQMPSEAMTIMETSSPTFLLVTRTSSGPRMETTLGVLLATMLGLVGAMHACV